MGPAGAARPPHFRLGVSRVFSRLEQSRGTARAPPRALHFLRGLRMKYMILLVIVVTAGCDTEDSCPEGFLRDNAGSCVDVRPGDSKEGEEARDPLTCTAHASTSCRQGDVWSVDSCGTFESRLDDCTTTERCVAHDGWAECESLVPADCSLTVAVQLSCSRCLGLVSVQFSRFRYDTSAWSTVGGLYAIQPGQSSTMALTPNPSDEVRIDWRAAFEGGGNPCRIDPTRGTRFIPCPPASGRTFTFACD